MPSGSTAGATENREAFESEVSWNDRSWPASSAGPAERSVAQPVTDCAPASSSAPWSAPFVNDGVSLTGVTEIVNVCSGLVSSPPLAVPPLSFASTPIVAVPFASGAGV